VAPPAGGGGPNPNGGTTNNPPAQDFVVDTVPPGDTNTKRETPGTNQSNPGTGGGGTGYTEPDVPAVNPVGPTRDWTCDEWKQLRAAYLQWQANMDSPEMKQFIAQGGSVRAWPHGVIPETWPACAEGSSGGGVSGVNMSTVLLGLGGLWLASKVLR
jgi:hypothetical protein